MGSSHCSLLLLATPAGRITQRRVRQMHFEKGEGPEDSVARLLRKPLNSLLLPGGFNRVLFG